MIAGTSLQADWQLKANEILPEKLGKTLVIAPHQDDESLGCGGTIALLRKMGFDVFVVFVSDGSMSHPNSKKYTTEKLIKLRESEAITALEILNVPRSNCTFLRLKDSKVPTIEELGFNNAVSNILLGIKKIKPQTILVPWQKDPHKDHRASWNIVNTALQQTTQKIKVLQYFIWIWALAKAEDLPTDNNVSWYKINIKQVVEIKQKAINAHISQVTDLIDDDPEGFMLSPEILNYFASPVEIFAESI